MGKAHEFALAGLGLLLLAGCGQEVPGETPEAVLAPATESGQTPSELDPFRLADGDYSGFVVGFDGQAIIFDPAEMLPDDSAPNGFRIDNPDDIELVVRVAPSTTVTLIDNRSIDNREVDLTALGAFLNGEGPAWAYGSPEYFFVGIEVREDQVVSIEEVYLP